MTARVGDAVRVPSGLVYVVTEIFTYLGDQVYRLAPLNHVQGAARTNRALDTGHEPQRATESKIVEIVRTGELMTAYWHLKRGNGDAALNYVAKARARAEDRDGELEQFEAWQLYIRTFGIEGIEVPR